MGSFIDFYFMILSTDQRLAVVMALAGFALAAGGVWIVAAPGSGLARWNRAFLARDLRAWGAGGASGNPAEINALTRRLWQSYGWTLVGGGLGAVMGAGVVVGLALSAAGLLANFMGDGPSLLEAVVFQCLTLGLALGYLLGTLTVTRVATGPAWADLRRRRVIDYRASWLGWGPFALAGVSILLLVVTLFSRSLVQGPVAREFRSRPSVPTIPTLAALAVWALLVPTLGALLCHWIATSPRALTFSDPQVARAADEMRRAISIGFVTSLIWASGGLTLTSVGFGVPFTLIASFNPATTPLLPLVVFGTLILLSLLGMLALGFGMSLNMLRGRLGGRLAATRPSLRVFLAEMTPL